MLRCCDSYVDVACGASWRCGCRMQRTGARGRAALRKHHSASAAAAAAAHEDQKAGRRWRARQRLRGLRQRRLRNFSVSLGGQKGQDITFVTSQVGGAAKAALARWMPIECCAIGST